MNLNRIGPRANPAQPHDVNGSRPLTSADGAILSVEDLTVSFDGFTVLDGLNFSINYGEMRFLIGPNGAGKTTLIDVITGKSKPDRGRVMFDGNIDLTRRQEHQLVRLGVGRKFQTPAVFSSLTVYENLEVTSGFRSRVTSLLGRLRRSDTDRIHGVLEQVGLEHRAKDTAGALSHGEKQWLEIAMLLVQEPKLLLLDEPVAGMTRRERESTGELLPSIGNDRSVLVVEHDMEFVRQFARIVTVLHLGKLLSEGTMEEVQQDPEVIRAYLGHGNARSSGSGRAVNSPGSGERRAATANVAD
jgi:urea transport system ATP-binding protein